MLFRSRLGCYGPASGAEAPVRLLGAGAILREVIAAAEWLSQFGVASEVWSVTSFAELARDARECERWNRLHPGAPRRRSHLEECFEGRAPLVAATDYVRAVPQMISSYLPGRRYVALGTDGFGRSDTRVALRRFFEVDRAHVALAALSALAEEGAVSADRLAVAMSKLGIDPEVEPSWSR